uniref:Phage tail tape measure protein, TP901 family n=1 Tax=Sphingobacterium sp. (strain 21) TaxID=743722 RepID=F4C2C3_SPHS2
MAKSRTDTQAVINLVINGQQSQATLKQLQDTSRKLTTEFKNMSEAADPAKYAKLRDELSRVNAVINEVKKSTNGAAQELSQIEKIAAGAFGGSMLQRAWDLASRGITGFITKNAELSDQMAGVMKTTGLNEAAVDRLNEKFKTFNTRSAKSELLGLAQVAGKLGFSAEKDVEGFVRAADKIGVALGEDLGGTEEALNSLGKLIDIFKINEDYALEDSILKVGSAINELGASGTANEKNLIDFAQRMAGIAPAAKISITDVMGLGATLDELGQNVEASSTAVGQFIVGMGEDIPKFAKIAKMEVADFAKLLKEDANEAFLRVLENSASAGGGIEALAKNMKAIDVEGAKGIAALGVLADQTDKLREKQDVAATSFRDGTSILNEFNTVNNNLAANLEKIQNRLAALWENSRLRGWLTDLTGLLLQNDTQAQKLTKSYENQKAVVGDLESQFYPLLARYDELKFKGELNTDEQNELHDIIQQIAKVVPNAVTEWNNYGDAMDINRDKVSKFTVAQKELLQLRNRETIRDLQLMFQGSTKVADIMSKQANELKKQREESSNNNWITQFFGVWEHDVTQATTQSKLAMGDAYEAAKKLRDEFGVKLTSAQQSVIDHFEKETKATNDNTKATGNNATAVAKQVINLEYLEAKLASLIDQRKSAPEGSKELARINKDIIDTERRIDAIKQSYSKSRSSNNKGISDAAKATEEYKKLLEQYNELDAKRMLDQLSLYEKQRAQLEKEYDDEIAKYQEFLDKKTGSDRQRADIANKIDALRADKKKAVDELEVRQERDITDKIIGLRSSLFSKYETELDRQRNNINRFYDQLLKEAKGNADREKEINEARAKDLTDAEIQEKERLKKYTRDIEQETALLSGDYRTRRLQQIDIQYAREVEALKQKYNDELQATQEFQEALKALEENYRQEKENAEKEAEDNKGSWKKQLAIDTTKSIADAVFQIGQNNREAETQAAIAAIEKQREKELSNKNLTEAQKKKINDKYDAQVAAEKRKQWEADKKASLTKAAIETALNIVEAFPNVFKMAAAAAVGVAQAAVIMSQKPPQFAKGGLLPFGPSHASGGISLINGQTGQEVGEIEGGEPILSRRTYANNREIVDKLLYSSMRQNGARVQVNPEVKDQLLSGRTGGSAMPQPAPVINVTAPPVDFSPINNKMDAMIAAFNSAQEKQVVLSMRTFEEEQNKIIQLRNDNNA